MTAHVPPFLTGSARVVTHACPECQIGNPRPFCACCGGHGNISEAQLARWQRQVLSELPPGLR